MAYVIPTAAELKVRYPAFVAVADATVDVHIADASVAGVDTSWKDVDYAPAIAALAAHTMALAGLAAQTDVASYLQSGVTAFRSGDLSVQFSTERAAAASGGGLNATVYGQAYKRLLRKNKGGPRGVITSAVDCSWGC